MNANLREKINIPLTFCRKEDIMFMTDG